MFKSILRNSLIALLLIYSLGSLVIYHTECWNARNKQYSGTVVGINNSQGRYSSTCLMNVNWDGIGEQVVNGGQMGCTGYTEGSRITVSRGWNPITGKNGTAYIPEDPTLLADHSVLIMIGMVLGFCVVFVLSLIGVVYFLGFLFDWT